MEATETSPDRSGARLNCRVGGGEERGSGNEWRGLGREA